MLLLALAVIDCITVDAKHDEIIRQDTALKKNVGNMRELQSLSAALVGQCADASLKPTLQKLADEFRYEGPAGRHPAGPGGGRFRRREEAVREADGELGGEKSGLFGE